MSEASSDGADRPPHRLEPGAAQARVERLLRTLLDVGVDGRGPFQGAVQLAGRLEVGSVSLEDAVGRNVGLHTRLAAASGFLTGLGGFITLPVAMPANVAGFYVLATRMVATTAVVRGYDVDRPGVRTGVLLSLVGSEATDLLRRSGVHVTGPVTEAVLSRLSGPTLMVVNKAVGFRIMVSLGERSLSRLGRALPLAGGLIGAGLDTLMLRGIAAEADRRFPPNRRRPRGQIGA